MNELQVNQNNLFKITDNGVLFPGYVKLKNDAIDLADNLRNIEVTEDTLKVNKKLVAGTRKSTDILKKELSQVRNHLLQPYDVLKSQVDEIIEIVSEAEDTVRVQTREFEQKERDTKEMLIKDLFEKHIKQYKLTNIYLNDFDKFLKPQYLNKTYNINKVEQELVEWFNLRESDLTVISGDINFDELILEYKNFLNLGLALNNFKQKQEELNKIKNIEQSENFTFIVFNKKDYELLKNYMKEMQIEYK